MQKESINQHQKVPQHSHLKPQKHLERSLTGKVHGKIVEKEQNQHKEHK